MPQQIVDPMLGWLFAPTTSYSSAAGCRDVMLELQISGWVNVFPLKMVGFVGMKSRTWFGFACSMLGTVPKIFSKMVVKKMVMNPMVESVKKNQGINTNSQHFWKKTWNHNNNNNNNNKKKKMHICSYFCSYFFNSKNHHPSEEGQIPSQVTCPLSRAKSSGSSPWSLGVICQMLMVYPPYLEDHSRTCK